jgi:sugar fermentation stimulation protein A
MMKKDRYPKKARGLAWPKLIRGTLIKRYKRFLADVQLATGEVVTAHCANSGAMTECCEPGRTVYLSCHNIPTRKLKYTWELIEMSSSLVGVNTMVPNRLVRTSIEEGCVKQLPGYDRIIPEVKAGEHSRLDLLLLREETDRCFVEVKNCTLVRDKVACFPDAVTARGLKHLVELQRLVSKNCRCVMFYLIQRMDAAVFRPADHIDPAYGTELRKAVENGIEILAYDVVIDLERIRLGREMSYQL